MTYIRFGGKCFMQMICRAQIQSWICFICAISVRSSFLFWQQGTKIPTPEKALCDDLRSQVPLNQTNILILYTIRPQETGLDFFVIIFVINKVPSKTQSFLLFFNKWCTSWDKKSNLFSVLNRDVRLIICRNSQCPISSSFVQN